MDITGEIHALFPLQELKNGFTKREFVVLIDSGEQYPQYITFQLIKDRCELLDKYKEGDKIKVYFNLTGREWVSPEGSIKYFNSLVVWKIECESRADDAAKSKKLTKVAEDVETPF